MSEQKTKRRPRFKRDQSLTLHLNERDKKIIHLVYENRLMTSEQVKASIDGSDQNITRRLGKLYHAGYLDRPEAQKEPFMRKPMVYALGDLGAEFLSVELDLPINSLDWRGKNRQAKKDFLSHTLMVSEFLTIAQLACRQINNIEFIGPDQIIENRPGKLIGHPLAWKIEIPKQTGQGRQAKIQVVPDSAFALRFHENGQTSEAFFFLEADRGSEPIKRQNLFRSSIYKKLLCYLETWKQKRYSKEFGFQNPRVLFVTKETSREQDQTRRIESMVKANKEADPRGRGLGMFCFASMSAFSLDNPENLFKPKWINGRGEATSLMD